MSIEKRSKYDAKEVAKAFNIPLKKLLELIPGNGPEYMDGFELLVTEAIDRYLTSLRNTSKSPHTKKRHSYFLGRFKDFIERKHPHLRINELNEILLQEFFSGCTGRLESELSPGTRNNYTSIIRSLLTFLYKNNLSEKRYSDKFGWDTPPLLPRYLEKEQLLKVYELALKKVHGYRCHAMLCFLAISGCRVSELSSMRICDFNVEKNYIYIHKGKGGKSRYIPMYPKLKKVILDYLSLTGVPRWEPHLTGYLFSRDFGTERKTKISIRSIQNMCKTIFDKLGYRGLTVHSFRHTFAVRCLLAKMPIHNLSMIMGHTNINTTYIYVQLLPHDLQQEVMSKYPFAFEDLISQVLRWEDVYDGKLG
ncbi:site-specific integrase [Paenibacillus sp.]|uniref:tyrosine-type recombinase/integrase n=1 Tax=Paenibacillus sp. TaxID=58172 RepID=UPI002D64EDE7|nr:site-specific integrase [Paenibacillus sp.]HZG84065.1 site-specific integrase [Paenibacillus sp.]